MRYDEAESYIRRGAATVPGWLPPVDATLFPLVARAHDKHGVSGDILEIGTYLGKTAILLNYLRRPTEKLVLNDVFEFAEPSAPSGHDGSGPYNALSLNAFKANWRRFHDSDMLEIIVGESESIRATDAGARDGSFRFVHIDGSHAYESVRADIRTAKCLLCTDGVVVFDDMIEPHTPGVAAAVWEAVATEGLVPLVLTEKLYGSWSPGPACREFTASVAGALRTETHVIAGSEVLGVLQRRLPSPSAADVRSYLPPLVLHAIRQVKDRAQGYVGSGGN